MTREEFIEEHCIMEKYPIDRAFLEYFDKIGDDACLQLDGWPNPPKSVCDLVESLGGEIGVYKECCKQGKTWKELLNWDPDKITDYVLENDLIL